MNQEEEMLLGFEETMLELISSCDYSSYSEKLCGYRIKTFSMITANDIDRLVCLIDKMRPSSIIDFGCGAGELIKYIADKKHIKCVGAEPSKKVCYELNRKYANTYLNYNSYNLNYIDSIEEKYDLVLLVDSLYFVADINSTILNLFKILSPNGKIIVFFSEYEFKHVEEKPITDKNTVLGKVLINNRIKYEAFDVTNNEYKYWSDALQIGAEYCKRDSLDCHELLLKNYEEAKFIMEKIENSESKRYLYVIG